MKKTIRLLFIFALSCVTVKYAYPQSKTIKQNVNSFGDMSNVRGFDYTPALVAANPNHHIDHWMNYDKAVTEHDLDLAKRLNLNQARVFVPYEAYTQLKGALTDRLRHFVQACNDRKIGVMVVVGKGPWVQDTTLRPLAREWVKFLTSSLSGRPGLLMWDIMNEPDYPPKPVERVQQNFANCRFMSKTFHELDLNTPITIGMAMIDGMEKLADDVDVLQFHDYSDTRQQIHDNIIEAKQFAAKVGKPIIDGELGCIARANPYDVALEEHMKEHMGWYIWELMIIRKGWGEIHGVFYEDGTVRDPAIAAAILGCFRNRGDILPAVADKEGRVTKTIDRGHKWLEKADASWADGLDIAETAANLLEAGELVPMRIPPTWEVADMRKSKPDKLALSVLIRKYLDELKPYVAIKINNDNDILQQN